MLTASTLLLALCLEYIVWDVSRWRQSSLFAAWYQRARTAKSLARVAPYLANPTWFLIPLVLLVSICQWIIMPELGALFVWAFGLIALLFSFGPRNLARDLESYLQARAAGQNQRASQIASHFAEPDLQQHDPDQQVKQGLLIQANQAFLGPIFGFILFGAIGAVLYRVLAHLVSSDTTAIPPKLAHGLRQLHIWINWLPARITALGYAVTGHFSAVIDTWQTLERDNTWNHTALLQATGQAALTGHTATGREDVFAHAALVKRTIVLWTSIVTCAALLSVF
jgi:membrane protein required for beta-lactamase induction